MIKVEDFRRLNDSEFIIPKRFWKYYDLYRRKVITLNEFAEKAEIEKDKLLLYLSYI